MNKRHRNTITLDGSLSDELDEKRAEAHCRGWLITANDRSKRKILTSSFSG
jgi:hypothetical protein